MAGCTIVSILPFKSYFNAYLILGSHKISCGYRWFIKRVQWALFPILMGLHCKLTIGLWPISITPIRLVSQLCLIVC